MSTKYLLPCGCGRKLEVGMAQAGLTLRCECGQELTVPSIRGLAALERTEPTKARTKSAWGPRQGLMLAGSLLAVPFLVLAGLGHWLPPPEHAPYTINHAAIRAELDHRSMQELVEMWESCQTEFDTSDDPRVQAYASWVARFRAWTWAFTAAGVFGLVLAGAGLTMKSAPPPPAR